nr:MAG TPA: hypothetical protein [Caudoviricetes sp.]
MFTILLYHIPQKCQVLFWLNFIFYLNTVHTAYYDL